MQNSVPLVVVTHSWRKIKLCHLIISLSLIKHTFSSKTVRSLVLSYFCGGIRLQNLAASRIVVIMKIRWILQLALFCWYTSRNYFPLWSLKTLWFKQFLTSSVPHFEKEALSKFKAAVCKAARQLLWKRNFFFCRFVNTIAISWECICDKHLILVYYV